MARNQGFKEITFPKSRIATMDICDIGKSKHHMTALLEVDVTDARRMIKEIRNSSKDGLSFTSWVVKCIGTAINEHKVVAAYIKGHNRIVAYDDVDVTVMVEKDVNGYKVPLPLVIRKVSDKNVIDIHREIRNAQNEKAGNDTIVIAERKKPGTDLFLGLPGFLRRVVWKKILLRPKIAMKNMGNVVVTSIGMMGRLEGWIIPISIHPISFALGSISKKPGIIDNEIVAREYLKMTVLIDHDVVDGAPAARFVSRLNELLSSGHGLEIA